MFKVTEVTKVTGRIYPDEDFLAEYSSLDIAALISVIAFDVNEEMKYE